jgi:hypothetical protein
MVRTVARRFRGCAAAGLLALAVLGGAAAPVAAGEGGWSAKLLPAPPFPGAPPSAQALPQGPRLERVSTRANEIVDEDAWFAKNGLPRPALDPGSLPESVPRAFRDAVLVRAFVGGDRLFLLYGKDAGDLRYLMAADPKTHAFQYGYDFQCWQHPPGETGEFTTQGVIWAVEEGGILYVSHGHPTYAKDSGGRNAYVTAIDPKSDKILWRSAPLVANARNFLVLEDRLVTGYGFTAEPDFLYLLDEKTGAVAARQPLKTGPEILLQKDGLVYIRCYDTDDVYRVRR